MLVVGIDLGESPEAAKRFRDKHHLTFPILVDPNKTSFPALKRGFAIPNNFVIDQHSIVRYSATGFQGKDLERTVKELLAEPSPASPPRPTTRAAP